MGRPKKTTVEETETKAVKQQAKANAVSEMDEKEASLRAEIDVMRHELDDAEVQMEAAAPAEKVLLSKTIERLQYGISYMTNALEKYLEEKATNNAPAPVVEDYKVLTSCLDKYTAQKQGAIDKAVESITEMDEQIADTQRLLDEATKNIDAEGIRKYSALLEDQKKNREYLLPALEQAKNMETIPEGCLIEEWETIREDFLPEWTARINRLGEIANEYRRTTESVLSLFNLLRVTRDEMQRRGKAVGCPDDIIRNRAVFTNVVNANGAIFFSEKDRTRLNDAMFKYMPFGGRL